METCEWQTKCHTPCSKKKVPGGYRYCARHSRYEGKFTPEDIPSLTKCITCCFLTKPTTETRQCDKCFEENPIRVCKWKNRHDGPCSWNSLPGKYCCQDHQEFENVSFDECWKCNGCRHWYIKAVHDICPKCHPEDTKYCSAKIIDGSSCTNKCKDGHIYCGVHSKYENVFTPEEFKTLPFCSSCKSLYRPDETDPRKLCQKCTARKSPSNPRVLGDPDMSLDSVSSLSQSYIPVDRKIVHAQQVSRGALEWICIRCGEDKPKDEYLTKRGYRLKCISCSEKEAIATAKYRVEHEKQVRENSKFYQEKRKEKRRQVIALQEEQLKMGCETQTCVRCFQERPLSSYINDRRCKTKQCYECRQKQLVCDSKRGPQDFTRRPRTRETTKAKILSLRYAVYKKSDTDKGSCETPEKFSSMLPRDYAYKLMRTPCVYCGKFTDSYCVNGLDRVKSEEGHTSANVVSCCEMCNVFKNDLPLKKFILHAFDISKTLRFMISPSGFGECPF